MIEQLDQFIADLEHEHGLIEFRLQLARELRASFEADAVPAIGELKPAPPPAPPSNGGQPIRKTASTQRAGRPAPVNKGKSYERVPCPDCGEHFAKTQLDRHRRSKHPDSAAKPVHPVERPKPPTDTRTVLRCSDLDCGEEFKTIGGITHHAITEHDRDVRPAEKIYVTPDSARSAA